MPGESFLQRFKEDEILASSKQEKFRRKFLHQLFDHFSIIWNRPDLGFMHSEWCNTDPFFLFRKIILLKPLRQLVFRAGLNCKIRRWSCGNRISSLFESV